MNNMSPKLHNRARRAPEPQKQLQTPQKRDDKKRERSIAIPLAVLMIFFLIPALIWKFWFGGDTQMQKPVSDSPDAASNEAPKPKERIISITLRGVMGFDVVPGTTRATLSCHISIDGVSGKDISMKGEIMGPADFKKLFDIHDGVAADGTLVSFEAPSNEKGVYACSVLELRAPSTGSTGNLLREPQRVATLTVR